MSRAWAQGSTREHRRVRALVLARAEGVCQLQLDVCTGKATEAHHTLGRGRTGDDPTHMVAACKACNLRVGDPTRHDPAPVVEPWWT